MAMNYGEIIIRSGRIIWKHKVLWIFGVLSGCMSSSGGSGSGTNFSGEGFDGLFNIDPDTPALSGVESWFLDMGEKFDAIPEDLVITYILSALAVGLVLAVIFFAFGVAGRIGLVRGVWLVEEGADELRFETIYDEAGPFFWRIVGFYLLLFLFGLLALGGLIAIIAVSAGVGLLAITPILCFLTCLGVPLGWLLSILTEQTVVAIAGEDLSIQGGFMRAWSLLVNNLVPMLIMSLFLVLVPGIVSTIIGLPMLLVLAPLAVDFMSSSEAGMGAGLAMSVVFLMVYIPVAIALNGMVRAYVGTAWTLVYRRLTASAPEPDGSE
jgi:hypothetical protein